MKLQDIDVCFDEKGHVYQTNDHRIMSVTTLLHLDKPGKYSGIPRTVLDRAADKGTEMHNAIECYEKYGLEREDLEEFRNYLFLKKRFGFEVYSSELMVLYKYRDIEIIGTTDLVIQHKGVLGLADLKRTAILDKDYVCAQLNLYRLGFQQTYQQDVEVLAAIHLREDRRKFIELPINEDYIRDLIDRHYEEIKEYERKVTDD